MTGKIVNRKLQSAAPAKTSKKKKNMIPEEQFNLIRSYLHHSSKLCHQLTESEHDFLFSLGDGYGQMSVEALQSYHLTWDWSHIRDSSDAALEKISQELYEILQGKLV